MSTLLSNLSWNAFYFISYPFQSVVLYANVSLEKDKEHVNSLSQQARAGFIARGTLSIGHDF